MPGNPGIPHYYCEFGEELQKAFENEDSVNSPTRLDQHFFFLKADVFYTPLFYIGSTFRYSTLLAV